VVQVQVDEATAWLLEHLDAAELTAEAFLPEFEGSISVLEVVEGRGNAAIPSGRRHHGKIVWHAEFAIDVGVGIVCVAILFEGVGVRFLLVLVLVSVSVSVEDVPFVSSERPIGDTSSKGTCGDIPSIVGIFIAFFLGVFVGVTEHHLIVIVAEVDFFVHDLLDIHGSEVEVGVGVSFVGSEDEGFLDLCDELRRLDDIFIEFEGPDDWGHMRCPFGDTGSNHFLVRRRDGIGFRRGNGTSRWRQKGASERGKDESRETHGSSKGKWQGSNGNKEASGCESEFALLVEMEKVQIMSIASLEDRWSKLS
jgi:hypothetical protein